MTGVPDVHSGTGWRVWRGPTYPSSPNPEEVQRKPGSGQIQQGISSMKCIPSAAAFVLTLSSIWQLTPAAAQAPTAPQNPALQNSQVEIAYVQPANPNYRPIYDRLKKLQVLEEL